MKKAIVTFLATGTYAGLIPFAPGTFGTLWGILPVYFTSSQSWQLQAAAIAAVFAVAIYLCSEAGRIFGEHDSKRIVIDEVLGYMVAFFLIPFSLFNVIIVFLLFRFFDILKPYPVGLLDRKVKGGLGVVVDDAAAGIYANICAQILLWYLR